MFIKNKETHNENNAMSYLYHHIGFLVWYTIFIFIIPFLIVKKSSFDGLKYYLPIIDLIANICSVSGLKNKQIFKDVYSLDPITYFQLYQQIL